MERSILFILHFILLSARHKTWCKDRRKNNNRKGFYLFFLNTASFSKTRENPYIFIYKAVQKKKPDRTPRCNKKEIGKAAQRQAGKLPEAPSRAAGSRQERTGLPVNGHRKPRQRAEVRLRESKGVAGHKNTYLSNTAFQATTPGRPPPAPMIRGGGTPGSQGLDFNPNRSLDHRLGVWLSFFGFPSPFVPLSASCLPLCLGVARYAETKVADNLHGSRTKLLWTLMTDLGSKNLASEPQQACPAETRQKPPPTVRRRCSGKKTDLHFSPHLRTFAPPRKPRSACRGEPQPDSEEEQR